MLDVAALPSANPHHTARLVWVMKRCAAGVAASALLDPSAHASRFKDLCADQRSELVTRLIMEQADPTANKRFTPWLVREYAAGRLILEDLGSANDTLTLFQRYARRLKPEDRDIQRYKNLSAAWQAVREFAERDEGHSNRAQKALDRAQAYAESRILRQDPDGFTVAVPLTEFAAKWWGRGTRWCTAAENNNAFRQYHQDAPLIVILVPGHGKFQLWATETQCQFMDAADHRVPAELSRAIWPWVGPLLLATLEKNGKVLNFIPKEQRSYDVCFPAVQQDGKVLRWVPQKHRSRDLCLAAVQQDGRALEWVPEKHRTHDLCLIAVNQAGRALEWVPQQHQTYDLCLAAVQQNGLVLPSVPQEYRTQDIFLTAVQQYGEALHWVPKEYRTSKVCLAAVQQYGLALEWVPKEHRSYDLCLVAARQNGGALQYVPQNHRTQDLCMAAVQQDGDVLRWVPEEHRSYDLCLAAVQQNGMALWWVPQKRRTYDICIAAVRQDGRALAWVPQDHETHEIRMAAVQQNGRALLYVPTKHQTFNLCLAALEKTRSVLDFIPAHLYAELLAKLPSVPEPARSWDLDYLTIWVEKIKTAPHSSLVQHA